MPSIVATLGTMSIYRGLHSLWAGGDQISADEVPAHWLALAGRDLFGVPVVVVLSLALLAAAAFILARTRWGRELYAVGSNPGGADLIGIPSRRRVFAAFVVAGTLAGLMGALWASRYATVDARVAFGFELTVIAAVVVGGVAIRGGSGTVLGIVLGALALLVIRNGLVLVRIDPLWLQGVYGLVILVGDHHRRQDRRAARAVPGQRGRGMRRPDWISGWDAFVCAVALLDPDRRVRRVRQLRQRVQHLADDRRRVGAGADRVCR